MPGGGGDGVIAKRLDLAYQAVNREGMQKIKKYRSADCVIGGFRYAELPVHIIGGVVDSISARGVVSFVRGARDTAAYGGSLYDYRTTSRSWWSTLRLLNLLDEGVRPRTVASR